MTDNKLNVDVAVSMAAMKFDGDDTKTQIVQDSCNECANETDADRCEAASKICNCIHNAAKSRGLSFDV